MSDRRCPNCLGPLLSTDRACPSCGTLLRDSYRGNVAARLTAGVLFVFVGIPAGLFGGCALVEAGISGSRFRKEEMSVVVLPFFAAALSVLFLLWAWGKR